MNHISDELDVIQDVIVEGSVRAVQGLMVECVGLNKFLSVGSRLRIYPNQGGVTVKPLLAEVVGFKESAALLMPYNNVDGVGPGARVQLLQSQATVSPSNAWLGRVVNAFGEPIDGKGALPRGPIPYLLKNAPPPASERARVKGKLDLGVRAINTFLTCCRGQRLGIFAGSGVGKSILMSMMARGASADISIIGLVGERGREVQEFIQDDLGEEGLKRSIIVVATSDEYALMRRQAAYLTLTLAEYFRDQGKHVLCLMDSVTRFAMAQREIGLSAGEPPTSKGYTPTVFAELPKLLERAGPGIEGSGAITGLFTVLVEGDDTNEPVSDTVRGILDGHIVLDRAIGSRGRYPAINILKSVSRTMPDCNTDDENELVTKARRLMATYDDMAEMIRLGAYRKGADAEVDAAIKYHPALEDFLRQGKREPTTLTQGYKKLEEILAL